MGVFILTLGVLNTVNFSGICAYEYIDKEGTRKYINTYAVMQINIKTFIILNHWKRDMVSTEDNVNSILRLTI